MVAYITFNPYFFQAYVIQNQEIFLYSSILIYTVTLVNIKIFFFISIMAEEVKAMQLERKKRNEEMKNKMKGSFASRFGKIVGVNI